MTFCFSLSVAANPFCQLHFIRNKAACDTLGSNATLNKSPMHSAVHRVHGQQKGPRRQSLSSLMGSERLRFHREDAHQMSGWERREARCQGGPGWRTAFWVREQNAAFTLSVFLNICRVELLATCLWLSCWKADPGDVCFTLSNFKQLFPNL